MPSPDWRGLALIGDPHLSSRVPGFRADDYPRTALRKLEWCLDYAGRYRLVPAILGDLFDRPRDNANWLVGELLQLFSGRTILAVSGNHDCRENSVTEDDTFSILTKSGHVIVPDEEHPWTASMSGRPVIVGGSCWGQPVPDAYTKPVDNALVIWLIHHDLQIPAAGLDRGVKPEERPGIDIVANGHLHRQQDPIVTGMTHWLIPGNLTRLDRSEASQTHSPSMLRIDINETDWTGELIEVPHQPFDEVFHESAATGNLDDLESSFVIGLAELRAQRTESGAGLVYFLQQNLPEFEASVGQEVLTLAELVTDQRIELKQSGNERRGLDATTLDNRVSVDKGRGDEPTKENAAASETAARDDEMASTAVEDQETGPEPVSDAIEPTAQQRTLF